MKKVMIVDDDYNTRQLVKSALQSAGYRVLTACDGQSCLKLLEKEQPDLILLDILMPGMSGWDTYQKIRKTNKKVRVVFLSCLEASKKRKTELRSAGTRDYIIKPFSATALISTVKKIVG